MDEKSFVYLMKIQISEKCVENTYLQIYRTGLNNYKNNYVKGKLC